MSRLTSLGFAFLVLTAPALLRAQVALPPLQPAPAPAAPALPAAPVGVPVTSPDPNVLKWDAEAKDFEAKASDTSATFTFVVTNVSKAVVSINSLRTSCGCTVAQLPSTPYLLGAGSNVSIGVTMDLRGKFGLVTKTVSVDSSAGFKSLLVKANIPQATAVNGAAGSAPNVMGDRAKNIQNALADRQAIFKGDCAKCHVDQGVGKMGAELYTASCGICHDAEHRAAMVPDLKSPRSARDLAFWQKWIMEGKPGTLMPAFAAAHGGPLTQEQVDSLTVYLFQTFPKGPQPFALPTPTPVTTTIRK